MVEPGLSCEVRRDRGEVTVSAVGEIDLGTAAILHEAVESVFALSPVTVVLDLTGVTFCASVGLSELIWAKVHADAAGVRLVVVPGPVARRMLTITGLTAVLDLRDVPQVAG